MGANQNTETTKIHEVTKITPLSNNSNLTTTTTSFGVSTLPLTYFDIFWFIVPPVERLFFYETTELTRPDSFHSDILPKLKHSLSLTLLHYLPLAGRIMWPSDAPKPAVYYYSPDNQNGDDFGVSFKVAESSSSSDLFNHGILKAVEYHPLVPKLTITEEKADVIAVQVTLFPNQGFSIGITSHHAILDGRSSTLFMKSWAYFCKQLQSCHQDRDLPSLPPELTPCFDRSVIRDPKGRDMVEVNKCLLNNTANKRSLKVLPESDSMESLNKLVRVTVELTRDDIKKLRDKIISDELISDSKQQLHLSTFVVTLAYVFVCIVKAMAKIEADIISKNVVVGFTADHRARLDPPVPVNYIGNCNGGHGEVAKASDLVQENGVACCARLLSDVVKGIDGNLESSQAKIHEIMEMIKQGAVVLSVAGSAQFDVYGSNFGWGKPKKVEVVSIDRTGAIGLAERRDGGEGSGVEIGVVLENQRMEIFTSLFADGLRKEN